MIGYLKGEVSYQKDETLVLLCGNVGYEILCTEQVQTGETIELFIYTHVREDALQLYGFSCLKQKDIFIQLIKKVTGVGPKVALKILSHTTRDDFVSMIHKNDIKALSKLPQVGKKKAEQIVLCLKDRLKDETPSHFRPFKKDLFSTLSNLGFTKAEIEGVLENIKETKDLQMALKEALYILNSSREKFYGK